MAEHLIRIGGGGHVKFIYDDALVGLLDECRQPLITRVSYVEPNQEGRGWTADMIGNGAPLLGPFDTRQEALQAEREWLRQNKGL